MIADGARVLRAVAGDPVLHPGYRVRAAAALLDLGWQGEWLALAGSGLRADRETAAHAAGTLAVYGGPADALRGVHAAVGIAGAGVDDRAAVLCTRLVAARGTPSQVDVVLCCFEDLPEPTVARWEVLAALGRDVGHRRLAQVRDDETAAHADRVRAAAALRDVDGARADNVRALAAMATDSAVEAADRVDALDELLAIDAAGPWAESLRAVVEAAVDEVDLLTALAGADILLSHLPDTAAEVQWAVLVDSRQHPATRTRAAAALLAFTGPERRGAVREVLSGLVDAGGVAIFDVIEAAGLLVRFGDGGSDGRAAAVLAGICADDGVAADDRYFAAAALRAAPATRELGTNAMLALAAGSDARTGLWIAEDLIARPVTSPAFWTEISPAPPAARGS